MQISTKKIKILKNRLGTHLIGPQWTFWEKFFWISLQKNCVPRMLNLRENIRTSKFWRKSKGKKQKNFENLPNSKNKSKLFHACEPLTRQTPLSAFFKINIYIFLVHLLSSPALFFIGSKLFCFFVFKRKYSVPC